MSAVCLEIKYRNMGNVTAQIQSRFNAWRGGGRMWLV